MIEVNDVTFYHGESDVAALNNVRLAIEDGEMLLLCGPSGSGKSTLIRAMNGLVPHFHGGRFGGEVVVDGLSTNHTPTRKLATHVGYVGQHPEEHSVYERVVDDVMFTMEQIGAKPSLGRKRLEETFDALGIAHLRDRRLDSLSGGERQRVAIAGALVAMPKHLVLDEPTSQLDPQSTQDVIGSLLALRDELGLTIVICEHRVERTVLHADRLALLSSGSVSVADPVMALSSDDLGLPVAALGRQMGWDPIPLSVRQARDRVDVATITWPKLLGAEPVGEEILRVQGLSVKAEARMLLDGIDLAGGRGEVIALMGRTGSGKTTLLRAIAGSIRVKGTPIDVLGPVAMVPQDPSRILFAPTVADELMVTLRGRKRSHSRADVIAEAERFNVRPFLEADPADLSSGQRTRVAIAAACAGDPEVVLLDEPTRGMDIDARKDLAQLIDRHRAAGKLVILATHDVELAAGVATRVVLLSEGKMVVDGETREVLSDSLTFSTQMNKVFRDPRVLTVGDAVAALSGVR